MKKSPSLKIDRRNFLKGALGVSAAGVLVLPALAEPSKPVDPDRVALLADTHISEDLQTVVRDIRPAKHLEEVIRQILAQPELPVAATVAGDCAYNRGLPGDYVQLAKFLLPLREAGVPVYLLLGNHDNRKMFWKAFPDQKKDLATIPDDERHVRTLSLPNVEFLLLDTLIKPDYTPGKLGKRQLKWVDEKLSTIGGKPVVLMAHHDTRGVKKNSLQDYSELLEIMRRHRQVKAFFYGHRHIWARHQNKKLWEVGLPGRASRFDRSGFVLVQSGKTKQQPRKTRKSLKNFRINEERFYARRFDASIFIFFVHRYLVPGRRRFFGRRFCFGGR